MDMSKGKSRVEAMKARIREKIRKKQGGSIKEKLAAARAKNPARNMKKGMGKEKVEQQKSRVRKVLDKKYNK